MGDLDNTKVLVERFLVRDNEGEVERDEPFEPTGRLSTPFTLRVLFFEALVLSTVVRGDFTDLGDLPALGPGDFALSLAVLDLVSERYLGLAFPLDLSLPGDTGDRSPARELVERMYALRGLG